MKTIFIAGIDTGVGKTLATGLLARYLQIAGYSVLTAKLAQTGCSGISEDISQHRYLMHLPLQPCDLAGLTCPYVFPFPASPHLASQLMSQAIDPAHLDQSFGRLASECDLLLLEGVGGICVPLTTTITTLDYLVERKFSTIIVTSPKLGSINHTLLTLNSLRQHAVPIMGLLYNHMGQAAPEILLSTRDYFAMHYPDIPMADIPVLDPRGELPTLDFSNFAFLA